ncbi:ATP-binding cassette domain-containing protein [Pseudoroseomonas wenyumeiae]|uniref:ABC transporter ATP-binding protein n=1 Tax=Teichococcus wenyumeiae TaxID=2478470 RepID=A0A3A9J8W8_9PROT|nr:ABC-F family ATP-binding cassette domain-containing protein [Pseudoroseomonas wenyumeiae]RKK01173.1 ABC transporter ATP-binding protein [Pseudoroseomonas wenyumeiae]RMI15127.1 ATP-binding cassette domain-containing protein [Pseudoroseomonas wenyumeiae]
MSLITLEAFGVTIGAPLFSNLSLTIHKGDRIGLVAHNGGGKSTLLRHLAERSEPTSGRCRYGRNLRVTLMRQEPEATLLPLSLRDVLLQALPAESREWEAWRADVALDDIAVPPELRGRPLQELSGGWQRMVLLAQAWLTEPDVLLMDEPTNHLDLKRVGQLQRWIAALPQDVALLVASHDRAFLDAVTQRTLFLRRENSVAFSASYTAARASLAEQDAAMARRHETELRQATQLRRQAAKLHNIGVNSGSDLLKVKTRQLKERAERIEAVVRPVHQAASAGQIRLADGGTHARTLLTLDDVRVATLDGKRLFTTGRMRVHPGDRVVLLGPNGAGKSRLLSLVTDAVQGQPQAGLGVSPTVIAGICDQSLSHLRLGETLHSAIASRFSIGDQRIRSLLAGAGFPVERQADTVARLSGGERARLAMLILRLEEPNFYLLDEPTNHLDIAGQEMLEEELQRREGACLLVSHDRRFVENVGTRFWLIERGHLVEADDPGGFFKAAMQ